MATPNERLATALEALRDAEINGIVRHDALGLKLRQRLLRSGFLAEIIKGWYRVSSPDASAGETSWYPFYWEFVRQYLESRFGDEYCLSAEASLLLHAGATTIPQKLVVLTKSKGAMKLSLPAGLSMFVYEDKAAFPDSAVVLEGLRVMRLPEALIRVPEALYRNRPMDVAIALRTVADASPLLALLLDRGKSVVARRLAGAFRANHQPDIADEIVSTMRRAGYELGETNPFESRLPEIEAGRRPSPYEVRIRSMWEAMRESVADTLPPSPGLSHDPDTYMKSIEDAYASDAYNSLSIEGYRVTPDLIECVRSGQWDPDGEGADRNSRDALAARGYFEAFQAVRMSVDALVRGGSLGNVRRDHRDWYQALFAPSVIAGILKPSDLAGYRNHPVFINGSQHVPPPLEAVPDAMAVLFDLIESEPEASVRAVLGHFAFVYIHPYGDGNGRIARFLMNAMLASGSYPWTVVRLANRPRYMAALESASAGGDIAPFAEFIADEMNADRPVLVPGTSHEV
jgi:fido (protein-threonine AMPylation protein)